MPAGFGGATVSASERLAAALQLVPSLGDHVRIPGSLPDVAAFDEVWASLQQAVSAEPANAALHAARGNLLLRRGKTDAAQRSYALAARFDPYDAPSRIALGELAYMAGDERAAQTWFDAAFALRRLYSPAAAAGARSALVLCAAGPWHQNVPLDFVVDPERWTMHRWYLPDEALARGELELPEYDIVVNAIGESVGAQPALAAAERFIAAQNKPAINDPRELGGTARDRLAATLAGIAGCSAGAVRRVSRAEMLQIADGFPLLVRPTDAHGGRGLERADDAPALAAYAARVPSERYDAGAFVDYRSADGFYRKYRVMFVDGVPFPYHLALDETWMIHYYRAPMGAHEWMRDEERRFLQSPGEALAGWETALRAAGAAVGLEYFGIDCTVLPDGTLFVFEADAAMLVHGFDPDPDKRAAFERIRVALDALFSRVAAR
jgi:tetratricopeptide (TPR) repeat protein